MDKPTYIAQARALLAQYESSNGTPPAVPPATVPGTNLALSATVTVSNETAPWLHRFINDGNRSGSGQALWGYLGARCPQWIQLDWPTPQTISSMTLYSPQDNWLAPVEPFAGQTFTLYGAQTYTISADGIPLTSVVGNSFVKWTVPLSPTVPVRSLRITIMRSADGFARATEVEVN